MDSKQTEVVPDDRQQDGEERKNSHEAQEEFANSQDDLSDEDVAGQAETNIFPTADGPRYSQSRLAPEFDADGSVAMVLSIGRDISEQKRIEETLRPGRWETVGGLSGNPK